VTHYALAIATTVFGWWSLTGLLLAIDARAARTFPAMMGAATVVLAAALGLLVDTRAETTVFAAYLSFGCGLLVWGWVELTFLLAFITGPRRTACPPGCSGAVHFRHAVEAILYHEFAILGGAVVVVGISWSQPNAFGADAYLLLWAMRTSAKLNLFLGVPNLGEEFLPAHLAYLASFFRRRPMNLLFPLSVTAPLPVIVWLAGRATAPGSAGFLGTGYTLLATLLVLGVLEHWFLVVPLPSSALWRVRARADRDDEVHAEAWSRAEGVLLPVDFAPERRLATEPLRTAARRAHGEGAALTPVPLDPSRLRW
jgi:putative photosynthetic complex assembly protein 2